MGILKLKVKIEKKSKKMKLLNAVLVGSCLGHGRLMSPPGRSSLKSFKNDPAVAPFWDQIVPNYNDHELFCGGFATQVSNGYKCGVCGDNYVEKRPRANELGGKYGSHGIIPRTYSSGSLIDVEIQITAHHQGFFQFKICKMEKNMVTEDEKCFDSDESIVPFADGSIQYPITDYFPSSTNKSGYWYSMQIRLPDNLECNHCVIQWRYHTGNSWGTDANGNSGIGLGYQEEFYGCADIEIISTSPPGSTSSQLTSTTQFPSTTNSVISTISTIGSTTSSDAKTTTKTTPVTKSTTTVSTTSKGSPEQSFCSDKKDGLYSHNENCNLFYNCHNGKTHVQNCPTGLQFNEKVQTCDWPANVNCSNL